MFVMVSNFNYLLIIIITWECVYISFFFHFCYCKSFCWVLALGCLTPSIHPLHMAGFWIPLLIPLMKAVWRLLTAMSLFIFNFILHIILSPSIHVFFSYIDGNNMPHQSNICCFIIIGVDVAQQSNYFVNSISAIMMKLISSSHFSFREAICRNYGGCNHLSKFCQNYVS